MLRRIKGRKAFTMPNVRKPSDHLPLTKARAILEIVKDERKTYTVEAANYQRHQGTDTRLKSGRNGTILGPHNNSNMEMRYLSRPGQRGAWTRSSDEIMDRAGSSYYARSQSREKGHQHSRRGDEGRYRASSSGDDFRRGGDRRSNGVRMGEGVVYGTGPATRASRHSAEHVKKQRMRSLSKPWSA